MDQMDAMDATSIHTRLGKIVGKIYKQDEDKCVKQFLGIPYAQPPVGKLRFSDPQPLGHLPKDPYEATKYGNSCSQQLDTTYGEFEGSCLWNAQNKLSEDCLYLNIWVPMCKKKEKIPVMVWIYGGAFYNGSSSLPIYNGASLATHGDVIVVNFNYRTGVIGFFATGDGLIKGNFGLKDQLQALKWVKNNISCFGGDPENITVFGESAGSSSIGYHLMSPYFYKGLFHKAIFQSGSPNSRWSFMTNQNAKERSKQFLQKVGYAENNNSDLIEFLKCLDIKTILENDWIDCGFLGMPWVPTVDNDYLTDEPNVLLKEGKFQTIDSIFGCNLNEGSCYCLYQLPEHFSKENQECLQTYDSFKHDESVVDWDLPKHIQDSVKTFYTKYQIIDTSDKLAVRNATDALIGDRAFIWPTVELTRAMCSKGANTYLYHLCHRASNEVWPSWMGVIHGADVQWIFGLPLQSESTYQEEEKTFTKTVISYISNFAKLGNPNTSDSPCEWPLYKLDSQEYLALHAVKPCTVETKLRTDFCDFWGKVAEDLSINN